MAENGLIRRDGLLDLACTQQARKVEALHIHAHLKLFVRGLNAEELLLLNGACSTPTNFWPDTSSWWRWRYSWQQWKYIYHAVDFPESVYDTHKGIRDSILRFKLSLPERPK